MKRGTALSLTRGDHARQELARQRDQLQLTIETMPLSLWEEDFSRVKLELDALHRHGVRDFRAHLTAHPELVDHAASLVEIRDVNQAAIRMMGATSKADLLGSLQRIFVPESRTTFIDELAAIASGRATFEGEAVIVNLRGERRQVLLSLTLPTDDLSRVLVSMTDITERKQAELALRRSEERYRTLVTASTSIVWTAAPDGAIMGAVLGWQDFTGQPPDAYQGWGWLGALHPDDRPRSERVWRRRAQQARPVNGQFRVRRHDGQFRRMVVKAVPVLDETGCVSEWIGTCTDVEDRLRFREEQRKRELEEILAAQSAREKQRIARKLHDGVRQQLVGIRMLAANLQKKLASRELPEAELMGEFARLVGDANTQVRALISDLAPARVEAADLLSALQRVAHNVEQWYGLACSVEAREGARARDDETADHLFYIAQEAMTNAAKHARASRIQVKLRRENHDLLLEVQDDGAGLPEDFEKRGGMGLANMRHRAELVGGSLEFVRSRAGTTVVCRVLE